MKRLPRTLSPVEIRVLGALLEKEQATPDYYPMTVRAVAQAASQKTHRDPVMELDEAAVQGALDGLFQEDVLAWRSRAGRTVKWKHNLDRRWGLTPATRAVLTLLLLRGPQTVGELRTRTERLHTFPDLDAVEDALRALATGEQPLARELERQPGQREGRWMHCVGDPLAATGETAAGAGLAPGDRVAALEARVAALERLVGGLIEHPQGDSA